MSDENEWPEKAERGGGGNAVLNGGGPVHCARDGPLEEAEYRHMVEFL